MQEGFCYFIGMYDFIFFVFCKFQKDNYICLVYDVWIEVDCLMCRDYLCDQGVIYIYVSGNGFLQYMVCIIVGILLEIGEGKWKVFDVLNMIVVCNCFVVGLIVVSCGLMFWDFEYKKD